MKVTDLRIGNLVKLNDESYHDLEHDGVLNDKNNIWIVKKIDEDGDINIYNEIENLFEFSNIEDIEPIPLTEEWLIRFGFDTLGTFGYARGDFKLEFTHNIITKRDCDFIFWIGSRIIRMYSVHQLQNLYFALTGEELTLKNEGL